MDIFHDIGFLYAVVDAFTKRLLPSYRKGFEDLITEIEGLSVNGSCAVEEGKMTKPLQPRHGIV